MDKNIQEKNAISNLLSIDFDTQDHQLENKDFKNLFEIYNQCSDISTNYSTPKSIKY